MAPLTEERIGEIETLLAGFDTITLPTAINFESMPAAISKTAANVKSLSENFSAETFSVKWGMIQRMSMALVDSSEFLSIIGDATRDFAYKGFDPRKTVALLYYLHKMSPDSGEDLVFMRDVMECCLLMLMRGPSVVNEKSLKKMSKAGSDKVRALISKYGIVPRAADIGPSAVTLSRVAACYPEYTCHAMVFSDKIDRQCNRAL